ncbi:hypothetical protein GCM10028791_32060 [Echinicola sediminis]
MKKAIVLLLFCLMTSAVKATDYNVLDFGAMGDGQQMDTEALQNAIDHCTEQGGGRVLIPAGHTVLTGTIYLKSRVTLWISRGAVLLGSPDIVDYTLDTYKNMYKNEPHMDRCLIFAQNANDFSIQGGGIIDGNGHIKNFNNKTGRPMLMRFLNCRDISLQDVTLLNPAAWTVAWLYCQNIRVDGIQIHSRVNHNGDGLDFDGCQNVRVANSSFDTSDDSICLQASDPDIACKNITITNCTFTSKWAGMRIGLLSRGDFESVAVSNCTFRDIQDSGLKIQMNEGGEMKNMTFSNLVMKNVPRPVFMTFAQQRACVDAPEKVYPMDDMHGFIFDNILVDNAGQDKNTAFFVTGMPGNPIRDLTFSNIHFVIPGGGSMADAARTDLPEYTLEVLKGWWPEFHLIGTLPASAFYFRHIEGLTLHHIAIKSKGEDKRPPVVLEDVKYHDISHVKSDYVLLKEGNGIDVNHN